MSIREIGLSGNRKGRLHRADTRSVRGWFCSLSLLRPIPAGGVENKIRGSAYLRRPPRDDAKLAKLLEDIGLVP